MGSDEQWRQVERAARSAERWANVSVWLSGCALVWLVGGLVTAIGVGVWVYLALR